MDESRFVPVPCDLSPGDLVTMDPTKWANRTGERCLTLWKKVSRTLEELHQGGNTEACGSIAIGDVCLVIARVSGLNGVQGTETDHLMLLVGTQLGWNTAHWFKKIQDAG